MDDRETTGAEGAVVDIWEFRTEPGLEAAELVVSVEATDGGPS